MKSCPMCGRSVSPNAAACPGCGEPIAPARTNTQDIKLTKQDLDISESIYVSHKGNVPRFEVAEEKLCRWLASSIARVDKLS